MQEESRKVAEESHILRILNPMLAIRLAPDICKQCEDGSIELCFYHSSAKAFARAILRACEEKEREILAAL